MRGALGLWMAAVLASALLAAGPAAAVDPLPMKTVAAGVYVYEAPYELARAENEGAIANVGFVVGNDAVAVIDTGNSLIAGQRLLAAVRARTPLPVRYVINTHMHPDHVLGNAAFRREGAKFVGARNLPRALSARATTYVDAGRRVLGDAAFAGTEVIGPDIAVQARLTLDLGGRKLDLQTWPTAHTDNDLTVFDPATGTLFSGDLLFVGHIPTIDGSLIGWLKVIGELRAFPAARVVPGHGPVPSPWPGALDDEERYLRRIEADTRELLEAQKSLRQASEQAGLSEKDRWTLFDEFNARNAIAAYHELEWE